MPKNLLYFSFFVALGDVRAVGYIGAMGYISAGDDLGAEGPVEVENVLPTLHQKNYQDEDRVDHEKLEDVRIAEFQDLPSIFLLLLDILVDGQ